MNPRTGRFELSPSDPYFWGSVLVLFGMIAVGGALLVDQTISWWGALMLLVGGIALIVRDYRRRVDSSRDR